MEDRSSSDCHKEGYSIFTSTIADMSWPAVEAAGRRGVPIFVPVAVVEQHGPHLPLATDIYGGALPLHAYPGRIGGGGDRERGRTALLLRS